MVYSEDAAFKVCEVLSKLFMEKKLVSIEERDTIVAEKLAAPLVMKDMQMGASGKKGVVKDEDFLDPFAGGM